MTIELQAKNRTLPSTALNTARAQGQLPAELYGAGQKNQHIYVAAGDFGQYQRKVTGATLVDLIIDGQAPLKALIGEIQKDPLTGLVVHIDFHQVQMDKEIQAKVPLVFTGVSKVVKEMGGTLIKSINELEITCLPAELISHIEVDLTPLENFDDVIYVRDLKLPKQIKTNIEPNRVVAGVKAKVKLEIFETKAVPVEGEQAVPVEGEQAKEGEQTKKK